jgi:hypothetical protein
MVGTPESLNSTSAFATSLALESFKTLHRRCGGAVLPPIKGWTSRLLSWHSLACNQAHRNLHAISLLLIDQYSYPCLA